MGAETMGEGELRFSCGIPLYHPEPEDLKHIGIYAKAFSHVYLYDNTEGGISTAIRTELMQAGNVSFVRSGTNDGLSRAYNALCRYAIEDGFHYLALYDQDSLPTVCDIQRMMDFIAGRQDKDVAVYGHSIRICHEEDYPGEGGEREAQEQMAAVEADDLISSGSWLNLAVYARLPGFDENLFIDRVDVDYCITAREHGYRILQVKGSVLYHRIGEYKKVLWKTISQHPPLRMYYIARNVMYEREKHGRGKWSGIRWLVNEIRHVLIYEDDKLAKVNAMLHGAYDCWTRRLGKTERHF